MCMKSLKLILRAATQRADKARLVQFKPPALPSCQYSRSLRIDKAHYQQYCEQMDWPVYNVLHPCYLQMVSLPLQLQCLTTVNSPFPVMGLIHKSNQINQQLCIDPDSPFMLYARYRAIRPHYKGWVVDIEVSASQHQQSVYRAVATYLVKTRAPHVAPRKYRREPQPLVIPESAREHSVLVATKAIGRGYAKLSKDYNPIHLSRFSASFFGFRQPIAHGMWSLARLCSGLPDLAERQNIKPEETDDEGVEFELSCEFIKPITLPATARSFSIGQQDKCKFWLTNDTVDVPHLLGELTLTSGR